MSPHPATWMVALSVALLAACEPGPAGAPGVDGSSCTVEAAKTGATIQCEDGSSALVEDGVEGPEGPPGPAVDDPRFGTNTTIATAGRGGECTLGQVWLTAGAVAAGTPAEGQVLEIASFEALFSLLGTTYGGDGRVTFALPDLRDAAPNGLTYVICTEGVYPSRL